MKTCPYCAEAIPDDAQVCPLCQMPLAQAVAAPAAALAVPGDSFPAGAEQTSGKAIASLVCGIVGLILLPFVSAIPAIVLGHLSLAEIQRSAGRLKGHGMALAGLVMGYIGVVFLPVILIIAAIAIPNLLRAKMAANEASAVGSLRSYQYALGEYAAQCPQVGFPRSLENLGPGGQGCDKAGLLDESLGTDKPTKSGYIFTYQPGSEDSRAQIASFTLHADPVVQGNTGTRHFFLDQTGVIHVSSTGPADGESPPIQ